MKRLLIISFWVVVIFLIVTYFTAKLEAKVDGYDVYGFPFVFYKELGGKTLGNDPHQQFWFWKMIVDILAVIPFAFAIEFMTRKLKG